MLNLLGNSARTCAGFTRRRLLQAGGAGLFGLTLPRTLAAEAICAGDVANRKARAKSVIFLCLFGGPSQLETFDMKPDAASKLRGPFKPVSSRTPGLLICEHFARSAAISDKFAVIRTMTHKYNDHSTAGHYIQTGHPWHIPIGGGFNATPKDWPAIGSVMDYLALHRPELLPSAAVPASFPAYVTLPNRLGHLESPQYTRPGGYGGWLGRNFSGLSTAFRKRDDKDMPYFRDCTDEELDFRIEGTTMPEGLTLDRLDRRRSLVEQFDAARRDLESSDATGRDAARRLDAYSRFEERAYSLVTSTRVRDALDIRREPPATRDRYGHHLFGQSCLMARRMVESGARFVTVNYDACDGYSWDSHVHSNDVAKFLIPSLDQALSALIDDLDQRGLLSETLVVCLGEMGRTPAANGTWGRGHWSTLFPAVLAGGGIRGGIVYGQSDKNAEFPIERPTSPEDLAATIFHALGIDPDLRIPDAQNRPVPLVEGGRPLVELFG